MTKKEFIKELSDAYKKNPDACCDDISRWTSCRDCPFTDHEHPYTANCILSVVKYLRKDYSDFYKACQKHCKENKYSRFSYGSFHIKKNPESATGYVVPAFICNIENSGLDME